MQKIRWKMVIFDTDFVIWKMQVDTKAVFIFLSLSIYFDFLTVFLTCFLSLSNLFSALPNIPSLLQPTFQLIPAYSPTSILHFDFANSKYKNDALAKKISIF
jgi:hypothetical protein